ncbi:MAG: endonuclease III [Rickettsiales bacterium]|nr:endonuclease III [Rickettsiales bacterium]|tara:strand:+ start:508 stop:1146 length:639 start_codon:yes stop_codon:yes gene_type:complete
MALTKAAIHEMFATLAQANPEPVTELLAPNPFCLLVAIILSAQATDAGVNKATPALFAVADTPEKMAALGEAQIRDYIKTIGLFNSKAKNVWLMSRKLLDEFEGQIPHTREALQSLPGVGRKTANVWLNCVLGQPTIAVDTHVFRVANRTGLVKAATVLETEKQLEKRIPKEWLRHAHHWLILHGRYVCKARSPQCAVCSIAGLCQFKAKTA